MAASTHFSAFFAAKAALPTVPRNNNYKLNY